MAKALISAGILFTLFPFSSTAIHSLKYQIRASSGILALREFDINGYVDDMIVFHYDSETKRVVPKQDWMENSLSDDYWDTETETAKGAETVFRSDIEILQERFNQTRGVNTVQYMYGCHWDDQSGETKGFRQHGYDGEDFLSLDVENKLWIAHVPQALMTAKKWNRVTPLLEVQTHYLTKNCIDWLKKYLQYGQNTLRRTVQPHVSLFERQDTGQLACHATGFYPEAVIITLKKDGVEIADDVHVGETLPNEDGTFQKSAVLMLSPEELQGIKYTCEVKHKSGNQIHYWIPETSSTPPLRLMGAIIGFLTGLLICLSCVLYVILKLPRAISSCDHLSKVRHEEDIQSSKHLDPASKKNPDVISKSSDSESSASSGSSLDSNSSDTPLMKKRST